MLRVVVAFLLPPWLAADSPPAIEDPPHIWKCKGPMPTDQCPADCKEEGYLCDQNQVVHAGSCCCKALDPEFHSAPCRFHPQKDPVTGCKSCTQYCCDLGTSPCGWGCCPAGWHCGFNYTKHVDDFGNHRYYECCTDESVDLQEQDARKCCNFGVGERCSDPSRGPCCKKCLPGHSRDTEEGLSCTQVDKEYDCQENCSGWRPPPPPPPGQLERAKSFLADLWREFVDWLQTNWQGCVFGGLLVGMILVCRGRRHCRVPRRCRFCGSRRTRPVSPRRTPLASPGNSPPGSPQRRLAGAAGGQALQPRNDDSRTREIEQQLARAKGKRKALVLYCSSYEQRGTHWKSLPNADNDGTAMVSLLTGLGFCVFSLKDPTRHDMEAFLKQLIQHIGGSQKDLVFIYFAGHGLQAFGEKFLVPVNATKDPQTLMPLSKFVDELLNTHLQRIAKKNSAKPAQNLLFFICLDMCRTLMTDKNLLAEIAKEMDQTSHSRLREHEKSRSVFFIACQKDGIAQEHSHEAHGCFTKAFLDAARDRGNSLQTIIDWVIETVEEDTRKRQRAGENVDIQVPHLDGYTRKLSEEFLDPKRSRSSSSGSDSTTDANGRSSSSMSLLSGAETGTETPSNATIISMPESTSS